MPRVPPTVGSRSVGFSGRAASPRDRLHALATVVTFFSAGVAMIQDDFLASMTLGDKDIDSALSQRPRILEQDVLSQGLRKRMRVVEKS